MCLRKLFPHWFEEEPEPEIPPVNPSPRKTALLFGINNYMGTGSDLSGCLNDIDDAGAKFENLGYLVTKFKDNKVTCSKMYSEIEFVLKNTIAGDKLAIWYSGHGTQLPSNHEPDYYDEALYLYDGIFTDDRMMELQQMTPEGVTVIASFDSCFAGGMAKGNPVKNRFHQMEGVPILHKRRRQLIKADSKWVVNAFCKEGQTSADAWFNNRANGAGTYYYFKYFNGNATVNQLMIDLHKYLPGNGFDQDPEILGNKSLFDSTY